MVSVCLPSDALSQLPTYLGFSYLGRGVSLHGCSSKAQPLLLTLDEWYLLTAAVRYGFPVVMFRCKSWTVKKAERRRIDAFELWCWRRLLRVPWTARRSNQSILKEISPGCSLEGMMLKLKLQYFGNLMEKLTHWKRL